MHKNLTKSIIVSILIGFVYSGHSQTDRELSIKNTSSAVKKLKVELAPSQKPVSNKGAQSLTDRELSTKNISSTRTGSDLMLVQQRSSSIDKDINPGTMASCTNILSAPVAAGNSFNGNMFDITATTNLSISTFAVTVDGTVTIAIFAKTGTFVGSETNSAAWTFLDSAVVVGAGVGVAVEVPVSLNYGMLAGSTSAFYVTTTDPAAVFHYTNGTAVGNTLASNSNLTIKEGNGGGYPFNVTFSPRNFNGNVIYCLPGFSNCNNSLSAPVAAGNSFNGNMFDITPSTDLTVQTFAVTVDGTVNIAIFARSGTYVGNETSSLGWTFLDSAVVAGGGVGVPVIVPVNLNYNMLSGSTHAFYVTATDPAAVFHYTNGTAVGNTLASNADLTIKEGNGGGYPFNVTFSPRNFNGNVIYCLPGVTNCNSSLAAPVAAGNSFNGNMFDLTASSTLSIETFSVTADGTINIAVFARPGTFVGNETSSLGWTFLDSAVVVGAGPGVPVTVPLVLNYGMSSGSTHAFYVTATDPAAVFHYTNGTAVGNTLASNANLTIKEGNGGGYPFNVTFSPRNFNGSIAYCVPTGINNILNQENVSILPNPASHEINISLPNLNGEIINAAIYNALGEVVLSSEIIANGSTNKISVSHINAGVYIVKIASSETIYSTRLVISN